MNCLRNTIHMLHKLRLETQRDLGPHRNFFMPLEIHKKCLKATLLAKAIVSLSLEHGQTYQGLKASYRPLSFNTRMFWKASIKSTQWWFSFLSHFMVLFVVYFSQKAEGDCMTAKQNKGLCTCRSYTVVPRKVQSCKTPTVRISSSKLPVTVKWDIFFISLFMTTSYWIFYTSIRELQTHTCFSVSSARLFSLQK